MLGSKEQVMDGSCRHGCWRGFRRAWMRHQTGMPARMQAVQARAAELKGVLDQEQARADSAERRTAAAVHKAAALSPALSADELADASLVRGRLAELAAAQSLAAAAAPAAATQRSDVEGGSRAARFGNPTHPQTAAVKHALAMQHRGVHGAFAQLGSVQDTRLSELLSASLQATLRTLVVDDTATRSAPTTSPRGDRRAALQPRASLRSCITNTAAVSKQLCGPAHVCAFVV